MSTMFLNKDFEGLVEEFLSLLQFATPDKPLLICLDGMDELSEEYDVILSWIPAELPKNVYLIVSTCTESHFSCLKILEVKSYFGLFSMMLPSGGKFQGSFIGQVSFVVGGGTLGVQSSLLWPTCYTLMDPHSPSPTQRHGGTVYRMLQGLQGLWSELIFLN